ncbi:hypothetical protein GY45DRAFT_623792 [Cubamyces sp. BRFM 1775]|nr:hypothetical protein GY45DRAFT_623792 [Cubamyces sp. BRFM 1775]
MGDREPDSQLSLEQHWRAASLSQPRIRGQSFWRCRFADNGPSPPDAIDARGRSNTSRSSRPEELSCHSRAAGTLSL